MSDIHWHVPCVDLPSHRIAPHRKLRPFTLIACILLAAVLMHPNGAQARDDEPQAIPERAQEESQSAVQYKTVVEGVEDKTLLRLLKRSSQLVALENRPPPSLFALERRSKEDLATIKKVLRSEGYYAGRIETQFDPEQDPVRVVLNIELGPQYQIKQYAIAYTGTVTDTARFPGDPQTLGLTIGDPAKSSTVVAARTRLLAKLANVGHPLATLVDEKAIVDHADNTMSLSLEVDPGPFALFGELTLEGAKTVDEAYLRRLVPWQHGDEFSEKMLKSYRERLLRTGLFQSAAVERASELAPGGTLPITIVLTERKHRSIGLGARYSTDEGVGFEIEWEHRNLFGQQETLRLTADLAQIKQELRVDFEKPNFRRLDQSFLATGGFGNQDTDAYEGPLATTFSGVKRKLNDRWSITAGIPLEYSNLKDFRSTRDYFLAGLRGVANRDSSDDKLHPTGGTRLAISATPYQGFGDQNVTFFRGVVTGTAYHSIDDKQRFILAGRARLGSVVGEATGDLPANQRFYAGGGDSIRGYAYQSVGPQSFRISPGNIERVPVGGRSLLLLSGELRAQFTESLGAVVFIDGGNAYDEVFPNGSRELQWAAGIGGRYFTAVGPIRLDFGFPLNPRSFDDAFQFYISIGQAF